MTAVPSLRTESAPPKIVPAFSLLKDFKPIETIVDGLPLPRGGLACLTAPTGAGKTTLCALLEVSLCRGLPFAGREVTRGSVLVLAGENPDDYTMHLAATLQDLGLDRADVSRPKPMGSLLVVAGTFSIDFELDYLKAELQSTATELVAVIVDTSAAFYNFGDENDNVAMRQHASILRGLATLPGRPAVIVLCHPTKNPSRENLLPRGGGSFLAEADSGLTLWKDEAGIVTLHWAGKIRGPSFDPIKFELASVTLEGYRDARGKPITSVAARALQDDRAEQLEAKALSDENTLLLAMLRHPGASIAELALKCGWASGPGVPQKSRVHRMLGQLKRQGLTEKGRDSVWRLSQKGKKEAEELL